MSKTLDGISELRKSLLSQLAEVGNQNLSPAAANACANLAGKILATVKMELDFSKLAGSVPSIDFMEHNGQHVLQLDAPRVEKDVSDFSEVDEEDQDYLEYLKTKKKSAPVKRKYTRKGSE